MFGFPISREDEANFPDFNSIQEARSYFKKRYGEMYREGRGEWLSDDHLCYFDDVNSQPVQISVYSDGEVSVHVVY